jgi:prevent-host-death family protein
MPPFISIQDAETDFFSLVDRVVAGEEFVITRDGVPCVRLVRVVSGELRTPISRTPIGDIASGSNSPDAEIEQIFTGLLK